MGVQVKFYVFYFDFISARKKLELAWEWSIICHYEKNNYIDYVCHVRIFFWLYHRYD